MRRIPGSVLVLVALVTVGCDRNIEPFDPNEKVEQPDLSKIFPEGAERSGDAQALRGEMPPAEEPAAPAPAERRRRSPARSASRPDLAGRVPTGAVLFLIARTGGGGPPTAVRRIADPSFPLEFEIGPEDRMIEAMPFDGPFELMARVDADRNAMTRNPGDLQGAAEGRFAPGASEIEIVIDEVALSVALPRAWQILRTERLQDCTVFRVTRTLARSPSSGDAAPLLRRSRPSAWVNVVAITRARRGRDGAPVSRTARARSRSRSRAESSIRARARPHAAARELLEETGYRGGARRAARQPEPEPGALRRIASTPSWPRDVERVGEVANEATEETVVELVPRRRAAGACAARARSTTRWWWRRSTGASLARRSGR